MGDPRLIRLLAAAAVAAASMLAAPSARAESGDVSQLAPGALVEASDAVVVAVVDGGPVAADEMSAWTFRVVRVVTGGLAADDPLRVDVRRDRAPFARGAEHLLFLRRSGEGMYTLTAPRHGARCLAEPGVRPVAEYAESFAACLGPDRRVAKREELAALLSGSVADGAPGVPGAAATDLLRHDDLWPLVPAELRARVTAALRRERKPDEDLAGVILAAGAIGGPGTDEALVARLLDPAVRTLRRHVGSALARRAGGGAGADIAARLIAALPGRGPEDRAEIAFALGSIERPEAAEALCGLVRDEASAVRIESAHALGLLARAVRAPVAGADPEAPRTRLASARVPLVEALAKSAARNEKKAVLWALAQIDTSEAWDDLRRAAADADDAVLRALAEAVLRSPRSSLLLDE